MINQFTLVLLFFILQSSSWAISLDSIFSINTKVSATKQNYIKRWLNTNCKDLSWALKVIENKKMYQNCGGSVEKVHIQIELAQGNSEIIFWIKEIDSNARIEWLHDSNPAWRLCSNMSAYLREDTTCTYIPY